MRARKNASTARVSSPAEGSAQLPSAATRPPAQVTELAPYRAKRKLPRGASVTALAQEPAAPRLDSARAAHRSSLHPDASSTADRRHLGELRDALQDGWEIVQPIFARPLWSAADDSATAFNFVLRGPSGTRLITVPEGRGVARFIRDRRLRVDYAH